MSEARVPRQPSRRSAIAPFHVMEVIKAAEERQRSHGDAIWLCAGQPSTPAPAVAREAARTAIADQVLGYTPAVGTRDLREAVVEMYARRGLVIEPDDVVITTGSSGGFSTLFLAAFDPGDTVVMARPGYPAYRNSLQALGCRVIELDCGPQVRYQPTCQMIMELAEKPAGVIIASPSNPTGTVIDAAELASIARWCEEQGVLLISDEIYHGISYGRATASAWETSRSGVVIGSLSKYFSMTGWRVGWMLVPDWLRRPLEVLSGNLAICPPATSQVAATAALSAAAVDELEGHVQRYAANRDYLMAELPTLGIVEIAPPDGAFYLWCNVAPLLVTDGSGPADASAWCAAALAATGVAMTPGIDFDTDQGEHFVRLCFAGSLTDLHEAVGRLRGWLARDETARDR